MPVEMTDPPDASHPIDASHPLPLAGEADPFLGTLLNQRYRLERCLGRGGMGAVYLARDLAVLSRSVVVKVMLDESFRSEWGVRKFRQEVEALARLRHPGIVDVLDQGLTPDQRPFFVMQYIEGQTLRTLMEEGPVQLELACQILRQMGSALTAAHEKGVLHRDLKPENVMLQPLGHTVQGHPEVQVKLIDFGLARVEDSIADPTASIAMLVGTFAYMAPEQLTMASSSIRSDVFSLAVVGYELMAGEKPFRPSSLYDLIAQQRRGPSPMPCVLRPDLPHSTEEILLQGLQFDPSLRPAQARDFVEALSQSLQRHSPPTPPLETSPPVRPAQRAGLEPPGGAVPLHSRFYVSRDVDEGLGQALDRHDSIVLLKGARQVGKTSLLARGLQRARAAGSRILLTDFQQLDAEHLRTPDALFRALAESIVEQLDLDLSLQEQWAPHRGANQNLERFLRRYVLDASAPGTDSRPVVWGMDEVDRLFTCPFGSSVFGLFRSWHNRRSLDPTGPWHSLTLAIAYATEAHLFITDLNQSPFNVGTRLELEDFTFEQVETLNRLHGSPLETPLAVQRLMSLVGGHPYLIRRALYEISQHEQGVREPQKKSESLMWLESQALREDGPFGNHLRRLALMIAQEQSSASQLRHILKTGACQTSDSFYRFRSAGLIQGDSAQQVNMRCELYRQYLERVLS